MQDGLNTAPTEINDAAMHTPAVDTMPHPNRLWVSILVFLIPLMLSNTLQSVSGTVGAIILGRTLGVDALAAVSVFFPLLLLFISFVIGLGNGSSVLTAQAFGAKNEERMKAVMGTSLTTAVFLGGVLAIVGGVFTRMVLSSLGTPASILPVTISFARPIFVTLPILFVSIMYTTLVQGTGDSKRPLHLLALNTVLNVVFSPILILGWVGFPRFGVAGAAYAFIAAQTITLMAMIFYLRKLQHPLKVDAEVLRKLRIDREILRLLLRLGIPSGVEMIMFSLSEIAVMRLVNGYGPHATAAYGAVNQVASYVTMPLISLSIAISIFGAQSIGANDANRLRKVIKSGVWMNYALGSILMVLAYVFAHNILTWFITNPATLAIAYRLLMITLWSYLILGNLLVLAGFMKSSGTVLWPMIFTIVATWLVELPVAYVLSHHIGIDGIWIGYPVSYLVGLGMQSLYYFRWWKRKEHRRLIG